LAGLARMVHKTEPVSQLKEDEHFSRGAREERQDREGNARKERQEIRREREARKESDESAEHARHEERRQARARREEEQDREDAVRGNDTGELHKVEEEAKREKQVAKQELQQQLVAQQKEEAAEAELKAAKAQLHALASRRVSDHTTRADSRALPALHRLPVEPSLENAEPVEVRPEQNVAVSRAREVDAHGDSRRERREYRREGEEGNHRSYSLSIRKQEPGAYPLSVRKQEPKGFTKTAISWDKAHGVRPIDSLEQESKARSIELADWSRAKSQKLYEGRIEKPSLELADFKVGSGTGDQVMGEPRQLEQEALRDGLTLVPADKSAAKSPSLAHRGLASDSRWEEKEGLRPVSASARRQAVAVRPFKGLHSQALLKREESQGDAWERRHQMIAFTSHRGEHSDGERQVLGDNEVPVKQAVGDAAKPAEGSQLVERAVDEAEEVGAAGVKALGFDNSKDFEKHLEKEGV